MKWEEYYKAHKILEDLITADYPNKESVSSLIDRSDPFSTKKKINTGNTALPLQLLQQR